MKQCKSCGQNIENSVTICPYCGKKQEDRLPRKVIIIILFFMFVTPVISTLTGLMRVNEGVKKVNPSNVRSNSNNYVNYTEKQNDILE